MPWKYNPFTDALDQTGSGGASYINGVVADPTALPVTLGTPALDSVFLAKAGSGVWLINRRPAGLYCRVANNGNLNDWVALGAFPEINADGNWELYNSTDPTKELKFDLSGISTGTTRTLIAPNANGTIALTSQIPSAFDPASPGTIGGTTPSAATFTNLTANTRLNLPNANGTTAGDIYRSGATLRYLDNAGTPLERIILNHRDNLANLENNATARTNIGLGSASAVTFGTLTATNGTLTASAPVLTLSQTWNNAAVTFTGLDYTITDTNSAAGSRAWDFKVGTTSMFAGRKTLGSPLSEVVCIQGPSRGFTFGNFGATALTSDAFLSLRWQFNIAGLARDAMFAWGTDVYGLNYDLAIQRDAADTLAQRRSTNPQTFRLYNTFTSTTNFERLNIIAQSAASVIIGTEKGSGGGTARALEFRTDNTARLTIGSGGGFTLADAQDIAVGTTTGTKIGTGTTQKIGFFNATPIMRPAAIADATDAATTQARLNDLLAAMRSLGLIAT